MSIEELLNEIMPFFILPVTIMILSTVLKIVKDIAKGCYIADMKEEIKKTEKELIKEPEKINIDKDLQKYFNYKE